MRLGDILEWLAGAGVTYTAWLATHKTWAAALTACLFLAYQAQCWATTPLTPRRKPAAGIERIGQPNTKPTIRDRLEGLRVRLYVLPRRVRARLRYQRRKIRPQPVTPAPAYKPTVGELMAGLDTPASEPVIRD